MGFLVLILPFNCPSNSLFTAFYYACINVCTPEVSNVRGVGGRKFPHECTIWPARLPGVCIREPLRHVILKRVESSAVPCSQANYNLPSSYTVRVLAGAEQSRCSVESACQSLHRHPIPSVVRFRYFSVSPRPQKRDLSRVGIQPQGSGC